MSSTLCCPVHALHTKRPRVVGFLSRLGRRVPRLAHLIFLLQPVDTRRRQSTQATATMIGRTCWKLSSMIIHTFQTTQRRNQRVENFVRDSTFFVANRWEFEELVVVSWAITRSRRSSMIRRSVLAKIACETSGSRAVLTNKTLSFVTNLLDTHFHRKRRSNFWYS